MIESRSHQRWQLKHARLIFVRRLGPFCGLIIQEIQKKKSYLWEKFPPLFGIIIKKNVQLGMRVHVCVFVMNKVTFIILFKQSLTN